MTFHPPMMPSDEIPPRPYRVVPRLWMAFVVPLVMMLCFFVIVPLAASPFAKTFPAALMIANILFAVAVVVPVFGFFRWLRPVFFERRLGSLPLLLLTLAPLAVFFIVKIATGGFTLGPDGLAVLVLLSAIQAGVQEELTFRGAAVFLGRTRARELAVCLVPAVVFGLIHLLNAIGRPTEELPGVFQQVVFAIIFGMTFYAIRRVTGTLLVPMAIHILNNASASFIPDNSPMLVESIGLTVMNVVLTAALLLGALAAVLIAVKFPRVPVLIPVAERDGQQPDARGAAV